MRLSKKKADEQAAAVELFIKSAQRYLGYSSELLGRTMFGQKVGYDSVPWSGAFIDVVAREAEVRLPSFTYSAAGLAESVRSGNFSRTPRPGDIAIFNFSSATGNAASSFSMPHCGIVTDAREFDGTGRFITIEGNTTGTGQQTKDGVHQKIRHVTEVVLFCRPVWGPRKTFYERLTEKIDAARTRFSREEAAEIQEVASAPKILKLNGEVRYGDRNKKIEIIQLALATVTDLRGAEPGKWDAATAAACSRFQRNVGRVGSDVTGLPDMSTLQRLSKVTGLFKLED